MKLSKKTTNTLETIINGMLVYQNMVARAMEEKRFDDADNAMKWFDQRADEMVNYGIHIHKYG
jgi:hypothetical protein